MTCEQVRTLLTEELAGPLPGTSGIDLNAHLSGCESCRREAELVRRTWSRMADLPVPDPRPYLATHFYAALDAYQQGLRERRPAGVWRWWPSKPAWQIAIALACLAVGFFAGPMVIGKRAATEEIGDLRKEMSGMRQLVTLSLLQQQSATERLRGVNYSYRAEPNDMEVLSALLRTVTEDSSVDVRLAAIDALRTFSNNATARRGLVQALALQASPLTQVAIIDALTELRERSAAPAMRQLLDDPNVDKYVRKRLQTALTRIE